MKETRFCDHCNKIILRIKHPSQKYHKECYRIVCRERAKEKNKSPDQIKEKRKETLRYFREESLAWKAKPSSEKLRLMQNICLDILAKNPPRKKPKLVSEKDIQELIKATEKPYHRLAILLGFYGMLISSEITNIKEEDILKEEGKILIRNSKLGLRYGVGAREIPILPIYQGLITKYLPLPVKTQVITKALRNKALEVLDVNLRFNYLRISGVSFWADKGVPEAIAKKMAGYKLGGKEPAEVEFFEKTGVWNPNICCIERGMS